MGRSRTVSEIKMAISGGNRKIFPPRVFYALPRKLSEFGNSNEAQKSKIMLLPQREQESQLSLTNRAFRG